MRSQIRENLPRLALGLALSAFAATAASAQTRLSLPAGTVIIVQTSTAAVDDEQHLLASCNIAGRSRLVVRVVGLR